MDNSVVADEVVRVIETEVGSSVLYQSYQKNWKPKQGFLEIWVSMEV